MRLAAVPAHTADPVALTVIDGARDELHHALEELRDLARGIHPAVLTQAGLAAALESMAERLLMPVELDVPQQRWDPAVESTAYFVACEALANTVKHAQATRAHVEVHDDGRALYLSVTDDGRGAVDLTAGSGLTGLRDRVAALGGELNVVSRPGAGTRLTAEIPCE
jgi:signal transduction histidine kinase